MSLALACAAAVSFAAISGGGASNENALVYAETNDADFEAAVSELISGVRSEWSDAEKALYLHDRLLMRVSYDYDEIRDTAYDAITAGKATSFGFARAYETIAKRAGLDCGYVESSELDGAWNVIKISGKYYYIWF